VFEVYKAGLTLKQSNTLEAKLYEELAPSLNGSEAVGKLQPRALKQLSMDYETYCLSFLTEGTSEYKISEVNPLPFDEWVETI